MSVWKRVIFIKELSNHVNSVFWNVFSLNYLLSAGPVAYIHHLLYSPYKVVRSSVGVRQRARARIFGFSVNPWEKNPA